MPPPLLRSFESILENNSELVDYMDKRVEWAFIKSDERLLDEDVKAATRDWEIHLQVEARLREAVTSDHAEFNEISYEVFESLQATLRRCDVLQTRRRNINSRNDIVRKYRSRLVPLDVPRNAQQTAEPPAPTDFPEDALKESVLLHLSSRHARESSAPLVGIAHRRTVSWALSALRSVFRRQKTEER